MAVDPFTIASVGIQGLAGIAQGIFGNAAAEKERKRQALSEGLQQQIQAQQGAAQGLQQGSQNAFGQLMSSYQNILGRK